MVVKAGRILVPLALWGSVVECNIFTTKWGKNQAKLKQQTSGPPWEAMSCHGAPRNCPRAAKQRPRGAKGAPKTGPRDGLGAILDPSGFWRVSENQCVYINST